jgi:hypothetical protein
VGSVLALLRKGGTAQELSKEINTTGKRKRPPTERKKQSPLAPCVHNRPFRVSQKEIIIIKN